MSFLNLLGTNIFASLDSTSQVTTVEQLDKRSLEIEGRPVLPLLKSFILFSVPRVLDGVC
jgi:hypothetical protein